MDWLSDFRGQVEKRVRDSDIDRCNVHDVVLVYGCTRSSIVLEKNPQDHQGQGTQQIVQS